VRLSYPLWADAAEVGLRDTDPDPWRHDVPEEALWPEIVDDRCYLCGQVVYDGLIECDRCFGEADAAYERRLDV